MKNGNLESPATRVFTDLWENRLKGRAIEYDGDYPKHEFLQWLVGEVGVVLHGSNHRDLEILKPERATGDRAEQALNAVYATENGAEAIFFAILDREAFRVARGGNFTTIPSEQTYAVSRQVLERKPWSDGCVYILNRASFRHVGYWVCHEPVAPVAYLNLKPQDFPYLDAVTVDEQRD